jgi:hypothetical protein
MVCVYICIYHMNIGGDDDEQSGTVEDLGASKEDVEDEVYIYIYKFFYLYVYIYICLYMYIYIYIYIYINMCTYIYTGRGYGC